MVLLSTFNIISSFVYLAAILNIKFTSALNESWVYSCSNIDKQYPQVHIIGKTEEGILAEPRHRYFRNQTYLVDVPDSTPVLILQCQASYPVTWIFTENFPQLSDNLRSWSIQTRRFISNDLWNKGTVMFESNLTFGFRAPAEPRQQICRSLMEPRDDANRSSNLITKVSGSVHGRFLRLKVFGTEMLPAGQLYGQVSRYGNDQSPDCTYMLEHYIQSNMICCNSKTEDFKFFSRGCSDPSSCQGFYKPTNCARTIQATNSRRSFNRDKCINGSSELAAYGNAGVIVCGSSEFDAQSVTMHYFTSVLESGCERKRNEIPKLYINEDPDKVKENMIKMCQKSNMTVYVNETTEFRCVGSFYYFSEGFQWVIVRRNGTEELLAPGNDSRSYTTKTPEKHFIKTTKNSIKSITFKDSSISKIICLAPVWDSFDWINQTVHLKVKDPRLTTFQNESPIEFTEGSVITCRASGDPAPILYWSPIPTEIQVLSNKAPGQIQLKFNLKLEDYPSQYSIDCVAEQERINHYAEYKFILTKKKLYTWPTVEILSILGGVLILSLVTFSIFYWIQVKGLEKTRFLTPQEIKEFFEGKSDNNEDGKDGESNALRQKYNMKLEISRKELEIGKELKRSGFSIIFKGKLIKNNIRDQIVISKAPLPYDLISLRKSLYELKLLSFIGEHENIVKLIGAQTCKLNRRIFYMTLEFCEHGDLKSYLKENRESVISDYSSRRERTASGRHYIPTEEIILANMNQWLLKWICQILNGLIHLGKKGIIHGDIAARNILVDSNRTAKICDFGLSHQIVRNYYLSVRNGEALPLQWLAPECIEGSPVSIESDVYSFGVLLWEIFTYGMEPWEGYSLASIFVALKSGKRLDKPKYATMEIYQKMEDCWNLDKHRRPTFENLHEYFSNLLKNVITIQSNSDQRQC